MKLSAPAALRNRAPIAAALEEELPERGMVLEIASGTGEHAVHFASRFPGLDWQPSDPDAGALASIAAWREEAGLGNLLPPLDFDVTAPRCPVAFADAMLCINMVHISPPGATEALFRHSAELLPAGAPLVLYGPFLEDEVPTAPSNLEFDAGLKSRNPEWGLRRVAWLDALAASRGLRRSRRVALPANNLLLVYRRQA